MTTAAFKARNLTTSGAWSLFADKGFDAAPGDVIELQLEGTPASDIWITVFSCVGRSKDRSAPVFTPSTGIAATPTSTVTFTMPAGERGTWAIQCQTNNGEIVDVNGEPDATVNTRVRYFAARTENFDLRHPLPAETVEYEPDGWAVALQELIDVIDVNGGQGPQGPAGPTGATGATGATGPTGPTGATGATGATGPAGSANASGTTNTIGKFTGSTTVGDSGITDDGTTVDTTRFVTVTKSGIGNTPTRAVTIINATNSGTQWGAQYGWSAIAGGTQINAALQFEPQSSSRLIVRFVHGTGSGVPSSSGPYWDLIDPNFGNGLGAGTFWITSAGNGFRFNNSSNRGGFDQDGSNNNRLKSYSGAGTVIEHYSDAGSTLASTPISFSSTGKGRVVATPHTVSSVSNAVTLPLATSQQIRHTTTENTTVTFSGAVAGLEGAIEFVQGGTGYTVTMPTSGAAVEYDAAIQGLGYSSIVDTTANHRTLLHYRVTDTPSARVYIWHRSVSAVIP